MAFMAQEVIAYAFEIVNVEKILTFTMIVSCTKNLHSVIITTSNLLCHVKGVLKVMALAANLRLLRKKAGFTQIELADKLGVSIATLRRWESGETAPTGTRIIELANLLGVSPDEIIKEDGDSQMNKAAILFPHHEASNGMLVFEGDGTRIELPPTEKGYEIFQQLITNLMARKRELNAESSQD